MTDTDQLLADFDEFPSFAEAHDMADRLGPLADYMDALGFDNDAELIRRIIDPQTTVGQLRSWKNLAMQVLAEWDKIHEELGKPGRLGQTKSNASLEEVQRWKDEINAAFDATGQPAPVAPVEHSSVYRDGWDAAMTYVRQHLGPRPS